MTTSGPATFFDGKTSARQAVAIELAPAGLVIRDASGAVIETWDYNELEQSTSAEDVLRVARAGNKRLQRLEVHDPQLAAAIDDLAAVVDRTGKTTRRIRRRVAFWSFTAVAGLIAVGIFGVPAIASRLAPLVPYSWERRLGAVVEAQTRMQLDEAKQGKRFECGTAANEQEGRAALDRMVGKLAAAAELPTPLQVSVVRKEQANAIALPGGHVYLFSGLIDKAENPDEVAGVLAHELGHVAQRDGTRSILQAAGASFLFGLVLGDFVGGGAVVLASRTMLQLAYSREVEAEADRYAVELMRKAHGDARAFATMLARIAGAIEPGVKILLDHPDTRRRVQDINAMAGPSPAQPFLTADEWRALKRICAS
jgi:predicted Zn-dependent protease